jgi:hypothetical protein
MSLVANHIFAPNGANRLARCPSLLESDPGLSSQGVCTRLHLHPGDVRCAFMYTSHLTDRAGLLRVLRYGLRPPLSQKRLSLTAQGKVRLALRKPLGTG